MTRLSNSLRLPAKTNVRPFMVVGAASVGSDVLLCCGKVGELESVRRTIKVKVKRS